MLKNQFTKWEQQTKIEQTIEKRAKYGNRVSKPGSVTETESKEKHDISYMGPYSMPELTIRPLASVETQSRLQHNYHGQPYA